MLKSLFVAAAMLALPTVTLADEVWETAKGDVIYEAEIGDVAVFSFPLGKKDRGMVYFPGLAGNYENRSVHRGYWIGPKDGECGATLTGVDGTSSTQWGRASIKFNEAAYPTGWIMVRGDCFADPKERLTGEPILAE